MESIPGYRTTIDDEPPKLTAANEKEQVSGEKPDDAYDPHEYGSPNGIGVWGATVHLIRSSVGVGILLMPYLMKNAGYANGAALMLCVSVLYYHTVHSLVSVEYRLCKMLRLQNLSFVGVADQVLAKAPWPVPKARKFVRYLIYVYYGLPAGNVNGLIVIATNIRQMGKYFGRNLPTTFIITSLVGPLTLFCMHGKILKILVPYSSVTNFFTFLMVAVVVAFSVTDTEPHSARRPFGDLAFIPEGLAAFILAIRCTGIVIPLKNNMIQPKRLSDPAGSLNASALTIFILYLSFGSICYINYGDAVKENILQNLPTDSKLSFFVYLLYSMAQAVAYILGFYVRFQTIWSGPLQDRLETSKYKLVVEYGLRIGINALAYLLAVGCPSLSLISAVSGTAGIVVEIALPSALQLLMTFIVREKNGCWVVAKNGLIICVCCVAFAMSAIRCVKEIKKLYSE